MPRCSSWSPTLALARYLPSTMETIREMASPITTESTAPSICRVNLSACLLWLRSFPCAVVLCSAVLVIPTNLSSIVLLNISLHLLVRNKTKINATRRLVLCNFLCFLSLFVTSPRCFFSLSNIISRGFPLLFLQKKNAICMISSYGLWETHRLVLNYILIEFASSCWKVSMQFRASRQPLDNVAVE